MWPGAATRSRPIPPTSWSGCAGRRQANPRGTDRVHSPARSYTDAMDDILDPHHGDAHAHGGRLHVHASVDHLAGALGASARLGIRLDGALMGKLGIAAD